MKTPASIAASVVAIMLTLTGTVSAGPPPRESYHTVATGTSIIGPADVPCLTENVQVTYTTEHWWTQVFDPSTGRYAQRVHYIFRNASAIGLDSGAKYIYVNVSSMAGMSQWVGDAYMSVQTGISTWRLFRPGGGSGGRMVKETFHTTFTPTQGVVVSWVDRTEVCV